MIINIPDELILQKLSQAAQTYDYYCNKDFLYISLSTNKNNLFMFEAQYAPEHFQHLCGINSETMSPSSFYKNTLSNNISISDCTPSRNHTRHEILDKLNSLISLLNMKNIRMYRAGDKIQNVGNIDFDFAVGDSSFIGYKIDARTKMCFPLTNMIAPIADYCVNPKRVSLILSKTPDKKLYDTVEYEVSKHLLSKVDSDIIETLTAFLNKEALLTKENTSQNILTPNEHAKQTTPTIDSAEIKNAEEDEYEK